MTTSSRATYRAAESRSTISTIFSEIPLKYDFTAMPTSMRNGSKVYSVGSGDANLSFVVTTSTKCDSIAHSESLVGVFRIIKNMMYLKFNIDAHTIYSPAPLTCIVISFEDCGDEVSIFLALIFHSPLGRCSSSPKRVSLSTVYPMKTLHVGPHSGRTTTPPFRGSTPTRKTFLNCFRRLFLATQRIGDSLPSCHVQNPSKTPLISTGGVSNLNTDIVTLSGIVYPIVVTHSTGLGAKPKAPTNVCYVTILANSFNLLPRHSHTLYSPEHIKDGVCS